MSASAPYAYVCIIRFVNTCRSKIKFSSKAKKLTTNLVGGYEKPSQKAFTHHSTRCAYQTFRIPGLVKPPASYANRSTLKQLCHSSSLRPPHWVGECTCCGAYIMTVCREISLHGSMASMVALVACLFCCCCYSRWPGCTFSSCTSASKNEDHHVQKVTHICVVGVIV